MSQESINRILATLEIIAVPAQQLHAGFYRVKQ